MSKTRVIYNIEGMFAGPAPATGYHFLNTSSGVFHNNPNRTGDSRNLVTPLHRIIGASYSFNVSRSEIKALGCHSIVSRPILDAPTVSLSFDYYQVGINNEYRLGFYTNYSTNVNSRPYFENNTGVYLASGFTTKSMRPASKNGGWPLDYRDKRNLFVAISKNQEDLNTADSRKTKEVDVIGFGNSYITSYSTTAAVGEAAKSTVNYLAENMRFYSSGSGIEIPAINYRDGTPTSGIICSIPSLYESAVRNAPAAILPGNINIDILSYVNTGARYASNGNIINQNTPTKSSDIKNIGLNFQNLNIEGYTINMEFRRENQSALNFKYPSDRRVTFPIYASLDFDVLVSNTETGSIDRLISQDADYDISIKLRGQNSASGYVIRYDFVGAKFEGVSYQTSIGQNKTARLSFSTELNPKDFTRGLFMSGVFYQSPIDSSFLLTQGGDFLLLEDGGRINIGADNSSLVI